VPPTAEEVENAPLTPLWMDANLLDPMKIMTVKAQMEKTMQDYLNSKFSEEELVASASLVI